MKTVFCRSAVIASCLAVAVPARGASLRVDLGTLGGAAALARDMNDRGQVVGCSLDAAGNYRAFLWDLSRGMVDLRIASPSSCAMGINDAGQVVGGGVGADGVTWFAFLWEAGRATNLGPGWAADINDVGQVLGVADAGLGAPERTAWVWEAGVRRDLPLPFSGWFEPIGINDAGRVAGSLCSAGCTPIVYDVSPDGVVTTLVAPGAVHDQAAALNERGQVLVQGSYHPPDGPNVHSAYLWDDGATIPIGTLGGEETFVIWAWWPPSKLNDHGEVVGISESVDGNGRGFLWSAGQMLDLGRYVEPQAINDAGQVAGRRGVLGVPGRRAFVWDRGTFVDIGYPDLQSTATVLNARGDALVVYRDAALNERAFVWFPSAPDEVAAVGTVGDALALLSARGELPRKTLDALDASLDAAAAQAAAGETCAAMRLLGAFQNKVAALVRSGRLSEASGQELVDAAAQSVAALGGAC